MLTTELNIWKNSIGIDPSNSINQRLKAQYDRTAQLVDPLLQRVAADFPYLTVHDMTHINGVWRVANLILGGQPPLTAVETYILGCAILLHDSAQCFAAYEDGRDGVRATTQWKDARAVLGQAPSDDDESLNEEADFVAIRNLHAPQAIRLATMPLPMSSSVHAGQYLIEDGELRNQLGTTIGQIAASHHWDIEAVVDSFEGQFNAPPSLGSGPIDRLRVACLLRCADAAHIDSDRAPDMLLNLLRRSKVSQDHWKAQNRLAAAAQSVKNPELVSITSTSPFTDDAVGAWWVAFDATQLAHNELASSNRVLLENSRQPFSKVGVEAAGDPETLSRFVQTDGWQPAAAQIHVGDHDKLVELLGEKVYGNQNGLVVALRELIQNARDAIGARQAIDPHPPEAKIAVDLDRTSDGRFRLRVRDQGIGMSRSILTGPLLDIGGSLWGSNRVTREHPGLAGSTFQSIGQFGIGFLSVLRLTTDVEVFSRRWNGGSTHSLRFTDEHRLRPVLAEQSTIDDRWSTTVVARFEEDCLDTHGRVTLRRHNGDVELSFSELVTAIAPALDVPVEVSDLGQRTDIPALDWSDKKSVVDRIEATSAASGRNLRDFEVDRLEPIEHMGETLGWATAAYYPGPLVRSVGGLQVSLESQGTGMVGIVQHVTTDPARGRSANRSPKEALTTWAQNQLPHFTPLPPKFSHRPIAALVGFGVDPTDVGSARLDGHYLTLAEICRQIGEADGAIFPLQPLGRRDAQPSDNIRLASTPQNGWVDAPLPVVTSDAGVGGFRYQSLTLDDNGVPKNEMSLIGSLHRLLVSAGCTPIWMLTDETIEAHHDRLGSCQIMKLSLVA